MQLIWVVPCLSAVPINYPLKAALCYQIIFIMIKHWYALYTKPQQEQKVTAALSKKGIESFCPLTTTGVYKGFGKKIHLQPLFPSFVFVHISESQLAMVRQVSDVINFMFWLGKPATIPAAELKCIRQFTTLHKNITVVRTGIVRNSLAATTHETSQNAFSGLLSVQKAITKLSLPSLGYMLTAETTTPAGILHNTYETNSVV